MKKVYAVTIVLVVGACASNVLPPRNSVRSRLDPQAGVVQVIVSDLQPMSAADLVGPDGSHYPATAVTLVNGPHVASPAVHTCHSRTWRDQYRCGDESRAESVEMQRALLAALQASYREAPATQG